MLRSASVVPPGSGTIHRASRPTYRPHGDTQEPLRCQPTPVSAIVKQPPLPPDLFRPPANPCKTLQSASICFILLCRGLTHFATKCSELFHFVSLAPVRRASCDGGNSYRAGRNSYRSIAARLVLISAGRLRPLEAVNGSLYTAIGKANLHRSPPMNQSETDLGIVNESQLLRHPNRRNGCLLYTSDAAD